MSCAKNNQLLAPYYQFIVTECAKLFDRNNSMHLDLANEIYVVMVSYSTDKLQDIIDNNKMKGYLATKIHNQRRQQNSSFNRLYSRMPISIELNQPTEETQSIDVIKKLKELDEFDKTLLALYETYGNYDAAAKAARISKPTLIRYINAIKRKLQ